jgi:hypothetical protein
MTQLFPETPITDQFVKEYERHRLAVTNQIRLVQDGDVISVGSSADFLIQVHNSARADTIQYPHIIMNEAERLVKALGFTGLRDFSTSACADNIDVGRIKSELKVLQLLGINCSVADITDKERKWR